jgi:hypothetical protein
MNCKKLLTATLSLAGAMLLAASANAQTVVLGAGSSAQFPTAGIAAVSPDPYTGAAAPCGTNLWTGKNGTSGATVNGIDPRSGTTAEPGTIWVAWDSSTSPTIVCAYLSVDSLVGLRLFFAQGTSGNGTLQFVTGTAAGNQIAGFPDSATSVPSAVAGLINGAHFNFAATDIRPEDGQYAFFRAANSSANGGFGYNPSCLVAGTPVWSSFSNTNAQVDCFRISGTDPISGTAIPTSKTVPLGAAPVLVLLSTNGTVGSSPTNILSKTAAKFFAGQIGSSQSVFGTGVGNAVMSEIQREPLSGTYNTFEFQVVHARDGNSSDTMEETGFTGGTISPTPAQCFVGGAAFSACTNPMYINSGVNSIRYRAIGTGEMVKAVNGNTTVLTTNRDALGYAFYSLGSFFTSANSVIKYLQLQGVDPLYSNYATSGLFGTCTGSITPLGSSTFKCTTVLPNFANIINGSYRTWSAYRWVINTTAPLPPAQVTTLLEASQDQAAYALNNPSLGGISAANTNITAIADFVPAYYYPSGAQTAFLKVFRSHYAISSVDANNGTGSPSTGFCAADQVSPNCIEEGGDMAGVAFQIATDQTYFATQGGEVLTQIE